jgi:hypothetical protein
MHFFTKRRVFASSPIKVHSSFVDEGLNDSILVAEGNNTVYLYSIILSVTYHVYPSKLTDLLICLSA